MATPREHIEEIRKNKFCIGGEDNPLTEDLYHAVKRLSADLYTKDVHFLMELIQNAEDNEYAADVEPSLEFVITSRDVTGVGAPATLLVFNNEKGFTSRNIESICAVGRSTKKGKRQGGYIGERGIGFKSVFLVTSQPYIFSNGYKIRFNEIPPSGVDIGYIVPEWIEDKPNIEDLKKVYSSQSQAELPNTVIVLPLRPEKVEGVKEQLANIHPEVILFMSKIKRFSVREDAQNQNPRENTVSVSQETAFQNVKNKVSELFTLHLSAEENGKSNREYSYYMWRQRFPVNSNNRVEERRDIDNWVITLAFPLDDRVTTGNRVGIYAFLPTEIVTGFPFIIQADFLLVSSRESIIWDNKWNQGILDCIPSAFCEAFLCLVKSGREVPPSERSYFFRYLPLDYPNDLQLRRIREEIQVKLRREEVILCEPENAYCRPIQARRILPAFRYILEKATDEGLKKPRVLSSTGVFIIHSCFDNLSSLDFLGVVESVESDWYSKCIQSTPGWLADLSEGLYVQLLCFIADQWNGGISSSLQEFPLFKIDNCPCGVSWASLLDISTRSRIYFSSKEGEIAWLTRWNKELGDTPYYKVMPNATQMAMKSLRPSEWSRLQQWLNEYPKITELSVSIFSKQLLEGVKASTSRELVIRMAQFLYFSSVNGYMDSIERLTLHEDLPVVSDSASIVRSCKAKLVPAPMGNWHKLIGDNPWVGEGIVALSPDYMKANASGQAGETEDELKSFIINGLGAVDIPKLEPPNATLPAVFSRIREDQVVLLLEWIHYLTAAQMGYLPKKFKESIVEGKWLKTHQGYESPKMSFLYNTEWSLAGVELNDLPFIDCTFYKRDLNDFKSTLHEIGVVVEYGGGCQIVAEHVQKHTDFKAITRLYKYLHRFHWRSSYFSSVNFLSPPPSYSSSVKIWIPPSGGRTGEWKDSKMCVVHDDNGLFFGRLQILEKIYEDELLPFFSSHLGVSLHPRIEDYCNLWLDWIVKNYALTEPRCRSVWGNILKHWDQSPTTIKRQLGKQGLKFPGHTSSGHIQLCAPNETFIPDDLSLKELFIQASTKIKFAWHPNRSDPKIPLDSLFSMYESLGARKISQAVKKKEVSIVSSYISLHRFQAGERLFGKGLYIIILGYLAYPCFKLSADKRHQIVRALLESSAYEAAKPFAVTYTLTVITEGDETEDIKVATPSTVRWEKDNKRILIQKPDPNNQMAEVSLATEFAEAVSKGLLSEHPDLVAGLCEMLKFGCILGFSADVVNEILQRRNFQIFKEDESFLSNFFPNEDSRGRRKSFGTSAGSAKSPQQFSPDFVEGWENRLQTFRQAIDNIKDCTRSSFEIELVRMLFPSESSDEEQQESSLGLNLMKVTGDACLKMLIVSEVLGADESCQMMPFKLENLLGDEVLELGKCFGRGGTTEKHRPSADGVDECDLEMLKTIAGAATLKFFRAQD